ncbi:MAG: polysaccharide biosynthesis/export family protein [Bacteroidales bacterium]|nr:polysaccharide biosynthesis/export family protein [Bacteroidales bacterium]
MKQNWFKIKTLSCRVWIVLALLMLASCGSYKKVPYMQNAEVVNDTIAPLPLYDAKIMPKDLLIITVNTSDPEAASPFNLVVQSSITTGKYNNLTQQPSLQQYLVNNDGEIDFPVLGRIKIGGLTKTEAENLIKNKLNPYLKETPIVNVRMTNYKISVLGEVARPGTFTVNNEKVNVLEALAMAGDMTVYGIRDNVKLIREDIDGKRMIITLNLNDANLILSPCYYLQQNDILYVTPNETKAKNSEVGSSTGLWLTATSVLVSIASLLVTILR